MLFASVASPAFRRAAFSPALRSVDGNLERFFRDAGFSAAGPSAKSYQLDQDDTSFTLTLDVPGLAKEHLTIGIEGAVVRIDSLADAPRSFKAAYELPQDIDATASQAKLELGVLTLKLGKKAPVSNVSSLSIN
jgi:HSP20 family protein